MSVTYILTPTLTTSPAPQPLSNTPNPGVLFKSSPQHLYYKPPHEG